MDRRRCNSARKARLFFALWPDATVAAQMARQADTLALTGHRVRCERLHLTLAFLGRVDTGEIARLCHAAAGIQATAFTLRLDRIGYFRRPRIVWLGCTRVPMALSRLATTVAGLAPVAGDRPAFQAHVSLARGARPAPVGAPIDPIAWPVRQFCLLESGRDGNAGVYRCLGGWPLHAAHRNTTRP